MRIFAAVLLGSAIFAAPALAQTPRADCPPGTTGSAPKLDEEGKRAENGQALGDKLARSEGIICPPSGVDPEIQVKPPEGGKMRVIPPPGSPGGDPTVRPK
jgi:hypothetical protein